MWYDIAGSGVIRRFYEFKCPQMNFFVKKSKLSENITRFNANPQSPIPQNFYLAMPMMTGRLCIGSALHIGGSTPLSAGTLSPHCCHSPSYLIALFCAAQLLVPLYTNCYLTVLRLLCGWSNGLEWSSGCTASDASGPLFCISLWP